MQTPGLSSVPLTRLLLLFVPLSALLTTSLALKPYVPISPSPHLYPWLQFYRLVTYQLSYLSSSEVLFATVLVYHLRVLERLFGTRKYVSAILVIGVWQAALATFATCVLQIVTWGWWAYLPGGATGVVMALVAMYKEAIPTTWRWRVSVGEATSNKGIMLSDKSTTYLVAAQLALSQFPYSLPPAVIGWMLGSLWRAEVLPGSNWRVPGWMVGEMGTGVWSGGRKRREFEGLRRRLEDEGRAERERDMGGGDGVASAVEGEGDGSRRRGVLRQVGDFFRGAI